MALSRRASADARAKHEERPKPEPTRLERQTTQNLDQMLADLPTACDVGSKKNSKGYKETWIGYKLHLDVACGQIPVSCVLTSASVHDSQVAIPLMTMTGARVSYLYDLMDAAYDAAAIHDHSKALGHAPIIDRNFRAQHEAKAEWARNGRHALARRSRAAGRRGADARLGTLAHAAAVGRHTFATYHLIASFKPSPTRCVGS